MQITNEEKQQIRDEAKSGKVGIETLKLIKKFKSALIAEIHKAQKNIKEGKGNALGTIFNFMDDACFLARLIRKYKDAFAEIQDLDKQEADELHAYFIECLKADGFNIQDNIFELVEAIDKYEADTYKFLEVLTKFKG